MKTKYTTILLCIIASVFNGLYAADIIFVSPVKGDYLLLHFREGEKSFAECHEFNSSNCPDIWNTGPINEVLAKSIATYTITSTDDPGYSTVRNPVSIGYKAKIEGSLMSYWIYLELPDELTENKTYTVYWGGLAANRTSETFTFNTKNIRSESIHINQVGYAPNSGMKHAYIYQWMGTGGGVDFSSCEGNSFYLLRNSDSSVVYSSADYGESVQLRSKIQLENTNSSRIGWHGCDVWECDFSDIGNTVYVAPGEYRIAVEGIGCSFPFRIDKEVYTDLAYLLTRGLFHQRSGPARKIEHTPFVKPIDHTPGVNNFKVTYSTHLYVGDDATNFEQLPATATEWVWPDNPHPHMNDEPDGWGWGGYFDAADCDKRRKHLRVSRDLLLVYEMNPTKFKDEELNIPESGNGYPDILDEAKWGIDFYRRLKGPTGGICGGLETTGYYHPSWEDNHMWYAYGEEAITSWKYSGLAAHLAYCLEVSGAEQAVINDWIQEAEEAYSWAGTESPGNQGKEYIEQKYYAAACLYRITGDHTYIDDFNECISWYNDLQTNGGSFVYCLTPYDRWDNFTIEDKNLQNSLKSSIESAACLNGLNQASERALRYINRSNPGISWGGYYPHVMLQMVFHHISDNDEVLDYLFTTADLYLGVNNDQQVSVSGAESVNAERTCRDLLNLDSPYDGVSGWIPGIPPFKHATSVYHPGYFIEPANPLDWPLMEQCNDIRYYIEAGEYTVYETISPMASLFSYLKALSSGKQMVVQIDSPGKDTVLIPGSDVIVKVSASVSEGAVSKVELYSGTVKSGEEFASPYEYSLESLSAGIYNIRAIAYSDGERKKSKPILLIVDDENPTNPLDLHVTKTKQLTIGIAWDPSTDDAEVKEYEVYVNDSLWLTSILNYCTVEHLEANSRYAIYVKAIDYAGYASGASNVVDTLTLSGKTIPGRIEAEDYDNVVGEVQIDDAQDTDGTDYVGWFDEGESLEYAVDVDHSDDYLATFRVARGMNAGEFELISGTSVLDTISVPNTGGWIEWINVSADVYLEEGQQSIIIKNSGNPFNINWIDFKVAEKPNGIIVENDVQPHFILFPNPVINQAVRISFRSDLPGNRVVVRILSMNSQVLYMEAFEKYQIHFTQQIALEGIGSGIYLMEIEVADQTFIRKFVKSTIH
ncbi:MAG: carbohydrate-binding protein [Bacteroidales bacterium]|nr:carbohydrate-binding protein [Bacteroidales bacterium]